MEGAFLGHFGGGAGEEVRGREVWQRKREWVERWEMEEEEREVSVLQIELYTAANDKQDETVCFSTHLISLKTV